MSATVRLPNPVLPTAAMTHRSSRSPRAPRTAGSGDHRSQQPLALSTAHGGERQPAAASGQTGLTFVSLCKNTLLSHSGHTHTIATSLKVRDRTSVVRWGAVAGPPVDAPEHRGG